MRSRGVLDSLAMNTRIIAVCFLICAASLCCQQPAAAPAPPPAQAHANDLGFTYSLPSDWEVTENNPSPADLKEKWAKAATSEAEKRGINCIQTVMTAKHAAPVSMVVVAALPSECLGSPFSEKDLPGFGQSASESLTQTFDVSDTVYGAYSLGVHGFWIERSKAVLKGQPGVQYTVETVCTSIKKGAVCWMALAADDATLATFEHGAVTLDGDAQPALVPLNAFENKPA